MATATENKAFNYDLFRKRVRLFDSDQFGERDLAVSQAVRQCAAHEPPLRFWEAAAMAFGGAIGEVERLSDEIARLEAEAAEQARETARLAAALAEAQQANARLAEENRAWESEVIRLAARRAGGGGLRWLPPKPLLVAAAIAIAAEWLTGWLWAPSHSEAGIYFTLQWLHALAMTLFAAWGVAVYKGAGLGPLLAKSALWIAGWAVAIGLFAWMHGCDGGNGLAIYQMMLPFDWWGTRGVRVSGLDAGIALFLLQWTLDLNLGLPITRALYSATQWVLAQEKKLCRR